MHDPIHTARARLGAASRWGNPEAALEAQQDLASARLERAIQADAATLRPDQRQQLAALLTGGPCDE